MRGDARKGKGRREAYLIVGSCVPVGNSGWVGNSFLKAVGSEGAQGDGGGAIDATDCPVWDWHCDGRMCC